MQTDRNRFTHWYQEPYAWLVAILPAIAVVAGFYTLRLAIISDDGLVTDDYYKKGLEINRVLERDERASALAIDASVELDPAEHQIHVRMVAADTAQLPPALRTRLMHATRAGLDQEITIVHEGNGHYSAPLPPLPAGHWYIQIETGDWRVLRSFSVGQPTGHPGSAE